jgi:hypothetical protein
MSILGLVLIIAVGALGAGYALWDAPILTYGTVNTGITAGSFGWVKSNDPPIFIEPGSPDPSTKGSWALVLGIPEWTGSRYEEDVAYTYASGSGTKTLTITLNNIYASYRGSIGVTIANTGTIPVKVKTVDVSVTGPAEDPEGTYLDISFSDALVEGLHWQIDQGDSALGAIYFHPTNSELDGSSYTVVVTIDLVQWGLI